jgi:hypothetical protein
MERMGRYYHATITALPVGENPGPKAYDYSGDPERQKLEAFLESRRPIESCSRLTSWFACDTPANSARYLDAELSRMTKVTAEVKLYGVEFAKSSKQPMVLVNAMNIALSENDAATAETLAAEYWRPTREWKFWEYTAPEVRVVEKVEWPDGVAQSLAFMTYQGDDRRLKQMLSPR